MSDVAFLPERPRGHRRCRTGRRPSQRGADQGALHEFFDLAAQVFVAADRGDLEAAFGEYARADWMRERAFPAGSAGARALTVLMGEIGKANGLVFP